MERVGVGQRRETTHADVEAMLGEYWRGNEREGEGFV
jgi:hypothetical protein